MFLKRNVNTECRLFARINHSITSTYTCIRYIYVHRIKSPRLFNLLFLRFSSPPTKIFQPSRGFLWPGHAYVIVISIVFSHVSNVHCLQYCGCFCDSQIKCGENKRSQNKNRSVYIYIYIHYISVLYSSLYTMRNSTSKGIWSLGCMELGNPNCLLKSSSCETSIPESIRLNLKSESWYHM